MANQVHLKYEPESTFFLNQYSNYPLQRTGYYFDTPADLQIWIRIDGNTRFQKPADCEYLFLRYRLGPSFVADKADRTRDVQDAVAIFRRIDVVYKYVAREQRNPDSLLAVFPAAQDLSHRKKDFDRALGQLGEHLFLKAAARIDGIPSGLNQPIC